MEEVIGFSIALVVMFIGVIGSILPGLPSTPLVLIGAIGHRFYFGNSSASNLILGLLFFITLLSLAMDYLAGMIGAKKMGATWRGVLGAIVGAIIGIFFSLPGILLGPFIGALVFELLGKREFNDAARAGVGATIGVILGAAGKLACCVVMMVLFSYSVISRSRAHDAIEAVTLAIQSFFA